MAQSNNNYYTGDTTGSLSPDNFIEGENIVIEKNNDDIIINANIPYASNVNSGVFKTSNSYGNAVSNSGYLRGVTKTYATYQADDDLLLISKGTLENVITGKDLTTKSYVDELVGNVESSVNITKEEILNLTSNSITKKVSGTIVRLDDVSPTNAYSLAFLSSETEDLTNSAILRYGKNLCDMTPLASLEGWQYDYLNDEYHGSKYYLSGTDVVEDVVLKQGIQYSISLFAKRLSTDAEGPIAIIFKYTDNTTESLDIGQYKDGTFHKFTHTSDPNKTLQRVYYSGVMGEIYLKHIQFEVGNEVTEYVQYISKATHALSPTKYYTTQIYDTTRILTDPAEYAVRNDITFATPNFDKDGEYRLRFYKIDGSFAYASEIFIKGIEETATQGYEYRIPIQNYVLAYNAQTHENKLRIDGTDPRNTLFQIDGFAEYEIDIPIVGSYEVGIAIGSNLNSAQRFRTTINDRCITPAMIYPTTTLMTENDNITLTCTYNQDINKSIGNIETLMANLYNGGGAS